MLRSEEEACKRWCPMTFNYEASRCCATDCQVWQWHDPAAEQAEKSQKVDGMTWMTPSGTTNPKQHSPEDRLVPRRGYCGLVETRGRFS